MSAGFDVSEFFDLFVQEATELIESLDRAVTGLEDATQVPELIEQIFRAAHSLKASAASQGFEEMSHIAHAMENVFDHIRNGNPEVSAELVDLLLEGVDALKAHLGSAIEGSSTPDYSDLLHRLQQAESLVDGSAAPAEEPPDTVAPGLEAVSTQAVAESPAPQAVDHSDDTENEADRSAEAPEAAHGAGIGVTLRLRENCAMPAARAWLIIQQMEAYGDVLSATPSLEDLKDATFEFDAISLSIDTDLPPEEISRIVSSMPDVAEVEVAVPTVSLAALDEETQATSAVAASVEVPPTIELPDLEAPAVDEATVSTDEGAVSADEPAASVEEAAALTDAAAADDVAVSAEEAVTSALAAVDIAQADASAARPAARADQQADSSRAQTSTTVRVNVESIDALMSLVGELVISRTRLLNLTQNLKERSIARRAMARNGTTEDDGLTEISRNLDQLTANLGMVVTEMQERVMQTRMVPVNQLFGRFPRLVRDVARREQKQVELVMEGGETELDRSVIEDIVDPLTHLLRNAVGHGIELPDKRVAAGKPERGIVKLAARQQQSMVVIEVSDDGAGIDPDVIRRKVVEKGLLSQTQAQATTDRQILDYIFAAGFSTAEAVSDVSGRGVGMDVVQSNIDRLGGQIEIESVPGEGTRISLRLPLTLAIIQGLLCVSAGVMFALPLTSVIRILRIERDHVRHVNGSPVVVVNDETLPLVSLAEVGEFQQFTAQRTDRLIAVVVTDGRDKIGLTVDEILGNEELVLQPLGELLQDVRIVNGAAILGDGSLALIVDVAMTLRAATERAAAANLQAV